MGDEHSGNMATSGVWRSDREPGESQLLASVAGSAGSLQRVGEWLYFLSYTNEELFERQLFRLPLDGSGTAEPMGAPLQGLSALKTDGESLFAALLGGKDRLGNPVGERGVARIRLADGKPELLFRTERMMNGVLAIDDGYLYWSGAGAVDDSDAIWRGRVDGAGGAVKLVGGWTVTGEVTLSSSFMYWSANCSEAGSRILRLAKSNFER